MTSTSSELRADVTDWLQRSDLAAAIPTFIDFATARFSDELRTPEMETIASTTVTGDWTALPDDFRAIRLIEAGDKVLEYRTPWQVQRMVQRSATPPAAVYTIQDMQFRIYPSIAGTAADLTYYAALTPLVSAGDSNWLLLKRPDVYLQGALFYAWQYLHDEARMQLAGAFVDKYIAETNRSARKIMIGSAPLAVRAG
jgi:hypothetical protein